MSFKVGDKITLRTDAREGRDENYVYYTSDFVTGWKSFPIIMGEVVVVVKAAPDGQCSPMQILNEAGEKGLVHAAFFKKVRAVALGR